MSQEHAVYHVIYNMHRGTTNKKYERGSQANCAKCYFSLIY